jgi:hypothetical protein
MTKDEVLYNLIAALTKPASAASFLDAKYIGITTVLVLSFTDLLLVQRMKHVCQILVLFMRRAAALAKAGSIVSTQVTDAFTELLQHTIQPRLA